MATRKANGTQVLEIVCDDLSLPVLSLLSVGSAVALEVTEPTVAGVLASFGAHGARGGDDGVRVRLRSAAVTVTRREAPPAPDAPSITLTVPPEATVDNVDVTIAASAGLQVSRYILENLTTGDAYPATPDPVTAGALVHGVVLAVGGSNELRVTAVLTDGSWLAATGSTIVVDLP